MAMVYHEVVARFAAARALAGCFKKQRAIVRDTEPVLAKAISQLGFASVAVSGDVRRKLVGFDPARVNHPRPLFLNPVHKTRRFEI
jgi:hypothetical protein